VGGAVDGVAELVGEVCVRVLGLDRLHELLETLGVEEDGVVGGDDLRAERLEDPALGGAGRVPLVELRTVAAGGGDPGEGDAGVATGDIDDETPRLQRAALLTLPDEGGGDAVLDAEEGVESLDLAEDPGPAAAGGGIGGEVDERGVPDEPGDVGGDGNGCLVEDRGWGKWRWSWSISGSWTEVFCTALSTPGIRGRYPVRPR